MSHKSYGQQAHFPGKWDNLQCLHFVSCNSSDYGFIVNPQAPNRKLIEKQNCPCATAVVQIISDHSTQHALLSHGQLQLDNYPCPSCLKPQQQTTRTSTKGFICCHWMMGRYLMPQQQHVQQWPQGSKKLSLGASKHTVHRCSKDRCPCSP
jgi:hypothetical protein